MDSMRLKKYITLYFFLLLCIVLLIVNISLRAHQTSSKINHTPMAQNTASFKT